MDSTKILIFYISTLLRMIGAMGDGFEKCVLSAREAPLFSNKDGIPVQVFMNGESARDLVFIDQYEKWLIKGFPYSKYMSVELIIGGRMVCDKNNVCSCPSRKDNSLGSCDATYKHVCVAEFMKDDFHWSFLFCVLKKDFDACVADRTDLAEKVEKCMARKGSGSPQETAWKNAQEVVHAGILVESIEEPYFFYGCCLNECINKQSYRWWIQVICSMLKDEISTSIPQCGEAHCEVVKC